MSRRKAHAALTLAAFGLLLRAGSAPAGQADSPPAPAPDETPIGSTVIPSEASKPPKVTEWPHALRVSLSRKGPLAAGCHALLVREWLRLRCDGRVFALSLLAGKPEGIAFWIGGEHDAPFGELLMPLRRGDRRVFQLWAPGEDASFAFAPKPALVVQESWLDGDAAPVVTAW